MVSGLRLWSLKQGGRPGARKNNDKHHHVHARSIADAAWLLILEPCPTNSKLKPVGSQPPMLMVRDSFTHGSTNAHAGTCILTVPTVQALAVSTVVYFDYDRGDDSR